MYQPVLLYDGEGEFVGYAINKVGLNKLNGSNIYGPDERDAAIERVVALNTEEAIKDNWPTKDDPEVQALLADATFHPINYVSTRVVDDEKSTFVIDDVTGDFDPDKSTIVWTEAIGAENPIEEVNRINEASLLVARKRAGLDA